MEKIRSLSVQEYKTHKEGIVEGLSSWLGDVVHKIDDGLIFSIHLITKTWKQEHLNALNLEHKFTKKDCECTRHIKKLTLKESTKAVIYSLQTGDSYAEFNKYPVPVQSTGAFVSQFRYFVFKQFQASRNWKFTPNKIVLLSSSHENSVTPSNRVEVPHLATGSSNDHNQDKEEETTSLVPSNKKRTRQEAQVHSQDDEDDQENEYSDLKMTVGRPYLFKSFRSHDSIESEDFISFYKGFKMLYDDFDCFLSQKEPKGFYVYSDNKLLSPRPVKTEKVIRYLVKREMHLQTGNEII